MEDKSKDIIVCRCEEVTMGEVREWIAKGYDTFDELKRLLRVGMGPCQGRGCREIIMREISMAAVDPGIFRPPVKPVKLGILAKGGDN
jgi:bacterioferritin-associated ferredoxin